MADSNQSLDRQIEAIVQVLQRQRRQAKEIMNSRRGQAAKQSFSRAVGETARSALSPNRVNPRSD